MVRAASERPSTPGPSRRAVAGAGIGVVLAATVVVVGLGAAWKAPCAAGTWQDGRQYRSFCYSDIVPLYGTEQLQGGRLPYLQPCRVQPGLQCDEYPVLTMYFMRAAAWLARPFGGGYAAFFWVNAVGLGALALATAWALWRVTGRRALLFALAPTLLIYAFVNWDLLAVACAAFATLAFLRRRDAIAGVLLGLGTAAKLYPVLLLVPFALHRWREGRRRESGLLLGAAAGAWVVTNVPFAAAAPHAWSTFFRFNAGRGADWDSLWFVACTHLGRADSCPWSARAVGAGSLVAFLAVVALAWAVRRARDPGFPRWTLGFPILVAFLLTDKVYSPQYGLWLVPWFALVLPSPWLFGAFEVADVAVFFTRFSWFGTLAAAGGDPAFAGYHGATLRQFQIALVVRAAVLLVCLGAWALRGRHAPGTQPPLGAIDRLPLEGVT